MNSIFDILKRLVQRILKQEDLYSQVGTVKSVSEANRLCKVELLQGEVIDDVKLIPTSQNDFGFMFIPKVGTKCIVTFLSRRFCFLSNCDELDTLYLKGDANGGLINIVGLTSKLNSLITEIDVLKLHMNTHTHAGVTVGSGVTAVGTPFTGSFSNFSKEDYEDDTVLH